jgi:hypothetical protein
MAQGLSFLGIIFAIVLGFFWWQHEHFKDLTDAEASGAACYMRAGSKGVASCMAICEVKWPNDPGCKAQVIKEYDHS